MRDGPEQVYVLADLDRAGIEQAVLVGHSYERRCSCRDAVKIDRHPGVQIEQTGPRDDRVQSWPHQA